MGDATDTGCVDPVAYLEQPFGQLADLINAHARIQPDRIALDDGQEKLSWSQTVALVNRIAAQLQTDGLVKGCLLYTSDAADEYQRV